MSTARKLRLRSRTRSLSPRKELVRKKSRKRRAGAESPTRSGDLTNTAQKKGCHKPIWEQVTIEDEEDIKFDITRKVHKRTKDRHIVETVATDQINVADHGNHGYHGNHGRAVDHGNYGSKRKDLRAKLEEEQDVQASAHKQPLDIPVLGLSTFKIKGAETMRRALDAALNYGYRLFDMTSGTNEGNIGMALRDVLPHHGLQRGDVYLICKLQLREHTFGEVSDTVMDTLAQLQTDYIDVVLLQWPNKVDLETILECYAALEDLHHQGLIRELGAYKFTRHQLEKLIHNCSVIPAMLQAEFHPYLYQEDLIDICREYSIRMQAFCFIKVLQDPVILKLSRIYDKAPSQIILRWIIQHGVGVLPKSKTPDHIGENAQIFDFCLTPQDMDWINSLNKGKSFLRH